MLHALISDLHANESAFRRVLADAKARGTRKIACLGDGPRLAQFTPSRDP